MEAVSQIQEYALTICEQGLHVAIKTVDDYTAAAELLREIKSAIKQIEDDIDPIIKKQFEAHRALTQKKAEVLKPFKEADAFVRMRMSGYLQNLERIRREEQRKAELAAQEAARKEQERLLEKAAKADAQGKTDKASALLEQAEAVYAEPVVIAPTVEKTVQLNGGSVTSKKDLEIKVIDLQELCRAIGRGSVPTTVISALDGKLKAWFKMQGTYSNGYAFGCQIRETFTPSVRG